MQRVLDKIWNEIQARRKRNKELYPKTWYDGATSERGDTYLVINLESGHMQVAFEWEGEDRDRYPTDEFDFSDDYINEEETWRLLMGRQVVGLAELIGRLPLQENEIVYAIKGDPAHFSTVDSVQFSGREVTIHTTDIVDPDRLYTLDGRATDLQFLVTA